MLPAAGSAKRSPFFSVFLIFHQNLRAARAFREQVIVGTACCVTLIETLFFYHPAVWWRSRQIRNERENCCDDIAMATVGSRVDYGRALLAIEELRATPPGLSLAAHGGSLLARIRRIAGCEPAPRVVGGGILAVILVSIAIFAAVTWAAAPAAEEPEPNPAGPREAPPGAPCCSLPRPPAWRTPG